MFWKLQKENTDLGKAELQYLARKRMSLDEQIAKTRFVPKHIYDQFTYISAGAQIIDLLENISSLPNSSYKVEFWQDSLNKNTYYKEIFKRIQKPHISLTKPKITYVVIQFKGKVYLAKKKFQNPRTYLSRKPHKRAFLHPSTIKPKLAKVMITIAGDYNSIYDPFCGLGGILIEAGHLKKTIIGSDIDANMIAKCKKHLSDENLDANCFVTDALQTKTTADAIISDFPYGKNTKNISSDLYQKFITHVQKRKLAKVMVLCVPNSITLPGKKITEIYIHKTLTRAIYRLKL